MLYLMNHVMKKIILFFSVFALFLAAGCDKKSSGGKTSEIPCPDNASCYVLPDNSIIISYNSLITLNEAVATLPTGYGILRTTSFELDKYSYETAFTEATVDVNFILDEYREARNKFVGAHLSVESNLYESHLQKEGFQSYAESERILVDDLTTILSLIPTPELKIKSVLAGGM